jgi:hypothetical protein
MTDDEVRDDIPAEEPRDNLSPQEKYRKGAPMELLIRNWHAKRKEDVHRKVAASSAATSRMKYRIERELEGRTVRPYSFHHHEPQQPAETRVDYERRLSRDRARARRGVDAKTVRPWTDLSLMLPEEKLLHQRKSASARQARRRRQHLQLSIDYETASIIEVLKDDEVEWGMF